MKKGVIVSFLAIVGSAFTLSGCVKTPINEQGADKDMRIVVTPSINGVVSSRAISASAAKATWVLSDKFGMYVSRSEDTLLLVGNEMNGFSYDNLLFTYNGANFATTAGTPSGTIYFPYRTVNVDLWGIFPYEPTMTTIKPESFEKVVRLDQSTAANVLGSDFLIAHQVGIVPNNTATAVDMNFKHKMARLTVAVSIPVEIDGKVVSTTTPIGGVWFDNMKLKGRYAFNQDSVYTHADEDVSLNNLMPYYLGNAFTNAVSVADGLTHHYEAICVPQTVASGTIFLRLIVNYVDGSKGLFQLSLNENLALWKGYQRALNVVFDGKLRLRLAGSKIVDWAKGSETSGNSDDEPTVTIGGVDWAVGNLVANGANGCKIGAVRDGGLYFQFGGLVGYKGGATGNGVGTPTVASGTNWGGGVFSQANDVAVTPVGYTPTIAHWPNFSNAASGGHSYFYINTAVAKGDNFKSLAGRDKLLGIEDPCAYYLGSPWRLPTHTELSTIVGSGLENPVGWVTATLTAKWVDDAIKGNGAWAGPTAKSTPSYATSLFMSAAGYRDAAGLYQNIGAVGQYQTSNVASATESLGITLDKVSGVTPIATSVREIAKPVRCVKSR